MESLRWNILRLHSYRIFDEDDNDTGYKGLSICTGK